MLYVALPMQNVSVASPKVTDEMTILSARLDGRNMATTSTKHPMPISERPDTPFAMRVRNNTDHPIRVWFVRFEGRSLAMAFLHYDLKLDSTVPAHSTRSIVTTVDFLSVANAATGYLDSALRVYDRNEHAVGQQKFTADVDGNVTSQVGLVSIELAVLALVCLIEIIVRVFRNSLPRNRFLRGLMFAFTGLIGAVAIVLGTAALRIALMPATTWVPLVVFATIIAFALGYLSPGPIGGYREEDENVTLDLVAEEAVARASGQHTQGVGPPTNPEYASGDHSVVRTSSPPSRDDLTPPSQHNSGGYRAGHQSGSHDPT